MSALAAKGISISTMAQFWECYQAEFLPVSPKFDAYGRFNRIRMSQQMSVATFTEAFREAYNGLLAIGAPTLPDEFLAYTYVHKLSDDIRRKVFQAVSGHKVTWAAVEAKALAIGAVAPAPYAPPPAKVNAMHSAIHGRCWNCHEHGHKAVDCPAKKKEAGKADEEGEEHK
uniref:CCHC-type domain-containing protein n=1 Tax=Dunaliella tertiolecta TaxID=3047 RepID=A0A7S3QKL0_DUNTE